jgi:trigger factor
MQASLETLSGLQRRITIQLAEGEVEQEISSRLKKLAREVRVAGFRPGKVPMSVIRQRFGRQVREEVLGELVQSSYREALTEHKVKPVSGPKIEPIQGEQAQGLGYAATFEVLPDVQVPALDSTQIRRPVVAITEADVDTMIETLRTRRVTWHAVERGAQERDRVEIRYHGTMADGEFPGIGNKEIAVIIGSGAMLPGFEEHLKGVKAGARVEFDLEIPADYRVERVAGRQVRFRVEARTVSAPELPAVDADFARAFGVSSGDLDEFRSEVRANMQRELEQVIASRIRTQVMDRLLDRIPLEVPQALVEREIDRLREQLAPVASQAQDAPSPPRNLFSEAAVRRVRLALIVREIVDANQITADPDRVRRKIEEIAGGYDDPAAAVRWYYEDKEEFSAVESLVLQDQVMDWVLERAQVTDEPISFDGIMRGAESVAAQPG